MHLPLCDQHIGTYRVYKAVNLAYSKHSLQENLSHTSVSNVCERSVNVWWHIYWFCINPIAVCKHSAKTSAISLSIEKQMAVKKKNLTFSMNRENFPFYLKELVSLRSKMLSISPAQLTNPCAVCTHAVSLIHRPYCANTCSVSLGKFL